jgi:hypothetical protein
MPGGIRRVHFESPSPDSSIGDLARTFSELLKDYLSPEQMAEVIRLNHAETNKNVSHAHDYLDANEVMAEAFEIVYGSEPVIGIVTGPRAAACERDTRRWNAAWTLAEKFDYSVPPLVVR